MFALFRFDFCQTAMAANDLCTSTLKGGQIVMANFFNIYDCLNTEDKPTVLAALGQDAFNQVVWIADW